MPYLPPLTAAELTSLEAWWRGAGGDAEPDPCGELLLVDERARAQRLLAAVVAAQRSVARAEAATTEALAALVALYRGPGTGDDLADGEELLAAVEEVAAEAELLVADDVSSALDARTELELWDALRRRGTTVVGSSSKRAALARADLVVVLEDGRVVATGPWERLAGEWGHLAG